MSGEDDERWRHATLDVADPATAVTQPDTPQEPITVRRTVGPFDPPRHDRFEEKGELGRGGMGRVFEARDSSLGRSVAIKQSLTDNEVDLARFERETLITARLQHPGIVPVLDAGRDDSGRPYYIMRKIEGRRLADLITDATTVAERIALVPRILGAVDAIAYAHARGVIHRDLKSWNVLLGDFGETLVIDWGLARDIDDTTAEPISDRVALDEPSSLTRAGVAYGTPGFMPPEQARGETLDRRADVYALGAMLLHALQGSHPFAGISARDAIAKTAADAPPDLSAIPDEVPAELTAIVAKAMEPKAADRYADAAALAEDLRRFTTGQLVDAHRYSLVELLMRWLRRHRVAVTVAVLAAIVLAVFGVISVRGVISARDRADDARRAEAMRADEMLIDRARLLSSTDPTSAVAALRELRPDSPMWPTARQIVRAAVRGGIDRKIGSHAHTVQSLAFSPDNRWLASADDVVWIHDLEHGGYREIAAFATALAWRDPRTLAFIATASGKRRGIAGLIDASTGALHEVSVDDPVELRTFDGRVLIRTRKGSLVEVGGDGSTKELATEVIAFTARAGLLAILHRNDITLNDTTRERTIAFTDPVGVGTIHLSPDLHWLAVHGPRGLVREWELSTAGAPHRWQLSPSSANTIEYVGSTLIAWTSETGFVSFDRRSDVTSARWAIRERRSGILTTHIVPFDGGAILVTDTGQISYTTETDTVSLPHRPVALRSIAVAGSGRWLALGGSEGAVLLIDLGGTFPTKLPMSGLIRLDGAVAGRALVVGKSSTTSSNLSAENDRPGAVALEGVALLDLDSRSLTRLDPRDLQTSCNAHTIVGFDWAGQNGGYTIWNSQGARVAELEHVAALRQHDASIYYVDHERNVWHRTIEPLQDPVRLGSLPADVRTSSLTGTGELLYTIRVVDDTPILVTFDNEQGRVLQVTGGGVREVVPRMPNWPDATGAMPGDIWWVTYRQTNDLWRFQGTDRRQVLAGDVRSTRVEGNHVWAINSETITDVDETGRVVRRLPLPWPDSGRYFVPGGVLAQGPTGVVELQLEANVQLVYRAPGRVDTVTATDDGALVVARTVLGDDSSALVWWRDPVPSEPSRILSYIESLTNARLHLGSDVLEWDDGPR